MLDQMLSMELGIGESTKMTLTSFKKIPNGNILK